MKELKCIEIKDFVTLSGRKYPLLNLTYQTFGKPLGEAPVIVVNHALTGNSQVIGKEGWWNQTVGEGKAFDTTTHTVICFNIPGNGYHSREHELIKDYKEWIARDVARIFLLGLAQLQVNHLEILSGSSLGGGIAWEMIALAPEYVTHFFAVATDWKTTDWVIANCLIQERLLEGNNPLHDARMHAMLCYRTPASLKEKFDRSVNPDKNLFNTETWLLHHGEKLQNRFTLPAYKLMNQLVKTIDIGKDRGTFEQVMARVTTQIHIIATNTDLYFVPEENRLTFERLQQMDKRVTYHEIISIHGHDAFLIEYQQLDAFIRPCLV
ncbi:alpha/beta fold hydrolase [Capnocytophaga sp. oral taxon 338]|uniref:alpha/beta fold hydrolase n=1 Tax=Capnocytophaga sp. oral taxon 338 TaxID=710239 RepID=UPI000202CC23|nr:alpha/beta fold hydrolase [Capnocytophaga sp. oral taxon 338]EGD33265.1 homoserine O-acetyltransferase [Capnocytophaga sp. oral taxon 338 str. F0234]